MKNIENSELSAAEMARRTALLRGFMTDERYDTLVRALDRRTR